MAESGVCSGCGATLPPPDALGLSTCTSCGAVTKASEPAAAPPASSSAGSGAPDAPLAGWPAPPPPAAPPSSGWPAPPVAAPLPGGGQWAPPAGVAGAPPTAPRPSSSGSTGSQATARRIGCGLVPLVVFLIVVFGIVGAVRSWAPNQFRSAVVPDIKTPSSLITLSGSATILPGDGPDTDLIVTEQDNEGSTTTRRLARIAFTDSGATRRWTSEPIDDSASRAEVAVVGDTIFAGIDDELLALDAETGATRWRTTLHDKVTTGCPSCFHAAGGKLVVRTTDAYVTAYGTASGEPLWSKRLNSTVGSISVVGDRLFVVDDPEDPSKITTVTLTDPATGKGLRTIAPTCPKAGDTPWDLEMAAGDPVLAVPGGKDVMAAFGFGDACVVRWEPASGTVRWTSRLTNMSTIQEDGMAIGERDLVLSNGSGQLVTIYLPNGKARQIETPSDQQVKPNLIVGRTLVADTLTARGTPKAGLTAWDLSTGDRLWAQSDLGTAQPVSTGSYHSSDALFDGSPRSLLVRVGDGINVFVFEGTEGTFTVSPLDLDSGDLGAEVRRAFIREWEAGTPSLTVEGIDQARLLISIDSLLQELPVSGRGPVEAYPPPD